MTKRFSTTIIVGAGQAGLAMSHELTKRSIDHCVLDRNRIGDAWRSRTWESLRLQTPNWANGLPDAPDPDSDPNGFLPARAFAGRLKRYARLIDAPVEEACAVFSVEANSSGFELATNHGPLVCQKLVLATGACAKPVVPAMAQHLPSGIRQITASAYRHAGDLPIGGVLVVGASASGVQIASEIQTSGRQVLLAVGNHLRLGRTYRGRDIEWWLEAIGSLDERFDAVDDLERVRATPSPQLTGWPHAVDLEALQDHGVEIVGRLMDLRGDKLVFSGGLSHVCASADLKLARLYRRIDEWVADHMPSAALPSGEPFSATSVPESPRLDLALRTGEIRTIVWATGYKPDFSSLRLPVFDRRGRLKQHGGVIGDAPGLYALGLPFMRRRRSALISGVGPDARDIAEHLEANLNQTLAA